MDFGGEIKAAIAWSTGGHWRQQMLPWFLVAASNLFSQERQVAWEGFSCCHRTTLSKSRRRETEKGAGLASPNSSKREGEESELREDTEYVTATRYTHMVYLFHPWQPQHTSLLRTNHTEFHSWASPEHVSRPCHTIHLWCAWWLAKASTIYKNKRWQQSRQERDARSPPQLGSVMSVYLMSRSLFGIILYFPLLITCLNCSLEIEKSGWSHTPVSNCIYLCVPVLLVCLKYIHVICQVGTFPVI